MPSGRPGRETVPFADERFFEVFLPRELSLVQQRLLEAGGAPVGEERFLVLYLLHLQPTRSGAERPADAGAPSVSRHLRQLMTSSMRPWDIPGQLGPLEYLAVGRDLEPERGHALAEQLLALARSSRLLLQAGLAVRLGYVVYPLSPQPDLAPSEWSALAGLARHLAIGANEQGCGGWGVVRGPQMGSPTIPEIDVLSLAMTDLDALLNADLLRVRPLGVAGDDEEVG